VNKTSMEQARGIRATTEDEAMQRQLLWLQHHARRNEFLTQLNAALDSENLERGTKDRSSKYSETVIDYDREFSMRGWK
tara:strand:- start:12512 stop:12748 length:237 start_codon:yes stop_codon:yes gene_type:complete